MAFENDGGPFFQDLRKGMKFRSRTGRTVTDADNVFFTLLTNNSNQIHFNKDYVEKYFPGPPFEGRLVVNGFFTLSTVAGLLVDFTSKNGFMLGLENLKFLLPVFAGDTLYAECEILDARESASRPGSGIVRIKTVGYKQTQEKVVEFDRTFMVRKRGVSWTMSPPRKP